MELKLSGMDFYRVFLIFHIICGAIALLTGFIAIVANKGGSLHMKTGKIFYWAMYAVGVSSFVLALMKFNPFLLSIGIFSLYMVISGYRALFYYRLVEKYKPTMKDKLPVYIGLVTALFMVIYPIYMIVVYQIEGIFILIIFGSILLFNVYNDLNTFRKNPVIFPYYRKWIIKHIGMMMGTYIATTTAFLVNVATFNPPWVLWLGPTLVGSFLIAYFTKKWKNKSIVV
ncbi:MAG: hypothetical protein SGJ10_09290 [Bacteroidota bacterium]|nr:hypothetical protein [Bacteroidota bacterium]